MRVICGLLLYYVIYNYVTKAPCGAGVRRDRTVTHTRRSPVAVRKCPPRSPPRAGRRIVCAECGDPEDPAALMSTECGDYPWTLQLPAAKALRHPPHLGGAPLAVRGSERPPPEAT